MNPANSVHRLDQQAALVSVTGLPNVMRQPHYHDHIELNIPQSGAMTYLLGGRHFSVEAGHFLAFWGAIPHQVIEIAPNTSLLWFYLPLQIALRWELPASFLDSTLSGVPLSDQLDPLTNQRFQQWHQDLSAGSDELYHIVMLEMEAWLRRLAWNQERDHSQRGITEAASGTGYRQARDMAHYIAQHFHEALTVEDIAQVVNLHPNYAMKVFRTWLHSSILDYLTRCRLAQAQRLLLTSDKTITEIGLEAGFGSSSRFYAVFKHYCGLPPGQYRRHLQPRP